jgi:hypothetical protein
MLWTNSSIVTREWAVDHNQPADSILGSRNSGRFQFVLDQYAFGVILPDWFLIALRTLFGAAPWIRWRFRRRTMLFAMTLITVVFGIITVSR